MNRDNAAYQPPPRRRDRGRPLTFAAVAVAAAAIGIAAAVIFLKNPVVSPAGYTPAAGSSSSAGNGNGGTEHAKPAAGRVVSSLNDSVAHFQLDAPTCPNCGHVAVRNGACYKCLNCGESLGCS